MRDREPRPGQKADAPRRAAPAPSLAVGGMGSLPLSAERMLALQRAVGNRAVCRLAREEHDGGRGHDGNPQVQRDLLDEALRSPSRPLDRPMQQRLTSFYGGYDFSRLQVHTGQAAQRASRAFGALAFTTGTHIVSGTGRLDDNTAAHEAGHAVQQSLGPVSGNETGAGVSVSDPGHREERIQTANGAAFAAGAPEAPFALQRACAPGTSAAHSVQRVAADTAFGHHTAYKDQEWKDSAESFEKRLGAYAFNHPRAIAAARTTVARMRELLLQYARQEGRDEAVADRSFFAGDTTSAGQVGENLSPDQIDRFFNRDGNVRELMTAIYNAAYYNTTLEGADGKVSLKAVMQSIIGGKPQYAESLGMNRAEVDKHARFLNSWARTGIEWGAWAASKARGGKDISYNYARDPYALGGIIAQSEPEKTLGDTREMKDSQAPRLTRTNSDLERNRKTADYYSRAGAPLSAAELAFAGNPDPAAPLSWIEGSARYKIDKKSQWARDNAERGMPTVAGMSGTTTRMLKTFQWLHVPGVDAFDFRMALMGWMLPSWDHSLYEILRGSWAAGVKGPHESLVHTSKGAAVMYQNIAPFSEEELREHVCLGGHFPHEAAYLEKANLPWTAGGLREPGSDEVRRSTRQYNRFAAANADAARTFKLPHAVAIRTYTGGVHELINMAVRGRLTVEGRYLPYGREDVPSATIGERFTPELLNARLKRYAREDSPTVDLVSYDPEIERQWDAAHDATRPKVERDEAMARIDERIDVISRDVYREVKRHADMLMEGISRLPGHSGTVYRGDWMAGPAFLGKAGSMMSPTYGRGKILTTSFDSASTDIDVAKEFMNQESNAGPVSHPVLLELRLQGKAGHQVSGFSKFANEREILVEPKAKFKVLSSEWKHSPGTPGTGWYELITAEEIVG